MRIKNTSVPCSLQQLFNKPHAHTFTLCPWSMQTFSFDCFPSQPSTQSEAGQQLYWLCHPWPQCLHSSGLRGTVQKNRCRHVPARKRPTQQDLKDDKASAPLTFQEVELRNKAPKWCLLPRGTCSPRCDLTHLTLD